MRNAKRIAVTASLLLALSPALVACSAQGGTSAGSAAAAGSSTTGSATTVVEPGSSQEAPDAGSSAKGSAAIKPDAGSSAAGSSADASTTSTAGASSTAAQPAAPSGLVQLPTADITVNTSRNTISTPYYVVTLPSSWTGHYKVWSVGGADLTVRDDGTGMGCTLCIARVDSDDPTALPTSDELSSSEVYSVTVFNDSYDVQGNFSAIKLGAPTNKSGWHVTVYGPEGSDATVGELADYVLLM